MNFLDECLSLANHNRERLGHNRTSVKLDRTSPPSFSTCRNTSILWTISSVIFRLRISQIYLVLLLNFCQRGEMHKMYRRSIEHVTPPPITLLFDTRWPSNGNEASAQFLKMAIILVIYTERKSSVYESSQTFRCLSRRLPKPLL